VSGGAWPEGVKGAVPGTFLVLAVTVHCLVRFLFFLAATVRCLVHFLSWLLLYMLDYIKDLKDCLVVVPISTSMFLCYSDNLVRFPRELRILLHIRTEQDLWITFIMFQKDGAVYQEQMIALC
jgi:hypothetical protein